ncbi:hypothetical protein TrRE_jg3189 [Triparma retinervis]|uniref:MOSC domain-containing protein n=1 Tax=Triparma retinervis TaxID=2557542 RepID=A0A9W7AZR7_9STRA|nr:hypothetical protein TrRE_jg3189 [Triparma retinervis]
MTGREKEGVEYGVYKVVKGRNNKDGERGDSKWGDCYPSGEVSGATDGSQVLVAFSSSLVDLNRRLISKGEVVGMEAFRPNVVLEGGRAWDEDRVRAVKFKRAVLRGRKLCHRCVMCTVDRGKGEWGGFRKGFEPLKTMRGFRCAKDERYGDSPIFGLNAAGEGKISVEDGICLGILGRGSNLGITNIADGYK